MKAKAKKSKHTSKDGTILGVGAAVTLPNVDGHGIVHRVETETVYVCFDRFDGDFKASELTCIGWE